MRERTCTSTTSSGTPGPQLFVGLRRSLSTVQWRLTLITFLMLNISVVRAGVEARVDDLSVDSMQTVQLQLRITGTNDIDDLDLAPLSEDFEIQGTSQQSQLRMVNGQVSSWVDVQITLRPKRTGTLTIPSLIAGGERSNPIRIDVRAVDPGVQRQIDRLVYFDIELDRSEVYVQAQLLYTRRLYYTSGVQIYGDLPGAPDVADAVVLTLGETSQNITMRGDTRYGVLEQRYAIFPERSGALTMPGFSIAASIVLPDGRRGIRVPAQSRTVQVLPIPGAFPEGATWLPARDVRLVETWTPPLAMNGSTTLQSGRTIQRVLHADVIGNTGSSIPELSTGMRSTLIRQYPEAPQLLDDLFGTHVTGRRTQTESLFPTWGGEITTSPVELPWWNTETRTVQIARLPAHPLVIEGLPQPTASQPESDRDANITAHGAHGETNDSARTGDSESPSTAAAFLQWFGTLTRWHLVAVLVVAVVLALGIAANRIRQQRRTSPSAKARREMQTAITAADPKRIRQALLALIIHTQGITAADAMRRMRADVEWLALHEQLGRHLYASVTGSAAATQAATQAECMQAQNIATRLLARRPEPVAAMIRLPPLYSGS
jgi:hypothetical protein